MKTIKSAHLSEQTEKRIRANRHNEKTILGRLNNIFKLESKIAEIRRGKSYLAIAN